MKIFFLIAVMVVFSGVAQGQIGDLIWEDNFNDLENWTKITGNGSWGWGNGELEYYLEDNVEIASIPGEPGNTALLITAKRESGPGIVDQWGNPLDYTSGRVESQSKVSIKYGMIEIRTMVPDLDLGGWPAVWLLGTSNEQWPGCGEIDMMEMGATQAFRDLHDEHNGGNGLNNSNVNQVVGANAIFYSEDAVSPENPSGAASLAWDPGDVYCRPYYNYADPLADRFMKYRLYWDESSMRFTVIDNDQEHDLYESPFFFDSTSDEFQEPFYLIANLAIGGTYTDVYNLGSPATGDTVSMPLPAEIYLDYIKVYEWNGQGEVHLGPPIQEHGKFGIFTDETLTDGGLVAGVTSEIYVWGGTLVDGSIPPYEGDNVLSWQTAGVGWFGAGIMADQPLNLLEFGEGDLKFMIKIPEDVSFKIGIIDTSDNQNYVQFPAHQDVYGLERNGQWGQVSLPICDLAGPAVDLQMLSYPFVIMEEDGADCEFALDDIFWDVVSLNGIHDPIFPAGSHIRLGPNVPNPFNATTEIPFDLPLGGPYEIEVFDAAGRRVADFFGVGEAGSNSLQWDGRDKSGRPLCSGTFFYRLKSGQQGETRKMMLVK